MLQVTKSSRFFLFRIGYTICYSRDALVTSTINCATSVLAGFVVFSTLGHMAHVSQKSVQKVIEDKGKY